MDFRGFALDEVQWRRAKVGFVTAQSVWTGATLRRGLMAWARNPSDRLQSIVSREGVQSPKEDLLSANRLHRMDERQLLLVRLFLLDKWLEQFNVA